MFKPLCKHAARQLTLSRTAIPRNVRAPAIHTRSYATATSFDWKDPLGLQSLLTEDELSIQETAESYCQEKLQPRVLGPFPPLPSLPFPSLLKLTPTRCLPRRRLRPRNPARNGLPRPTRRHHHRLWLRRRIQRRIRPHHPRRRARRFRVSEWDVCAVESRHGRYCRTRHGGDERALFACHGAWRTPRVFWVDGTESR